MKSYSFDIRNEELTNKLTGIMSQLNQTKKNKPKVIRWFKKIMMDSHFFSGPMIQVLTLFQSYRLVAKMTHSNAQTNKTVLEKYLKLDQGNRYKC